MTSVELFVRDKRGVGERVDAVDTITATDVRACFTSLDIAAGETSPDTFPDEWCEGGDTA